MVSNYLPFSLLKIGLMSSIIQESPAPNMIDDGHTMSSDMSGPVSFKFL